MRTPNMNVGSGCPPVFMPLFRFSIQIPLVAVLLAMGATAQAQTEEVAPEALRKRALTKTSTSRPDGWKVTTKIGASLTVTDARSVVGATEGTAVQVGLNLTAEAKYKHGQHTWDSILKIQEAFQRTPPPDEQTSAQFVKSLDILDVVSTYVFRFTEPSWLGPFVQLKLTSQILETAVEPSQRYVVQKIDENGNQQPEIRAANTTLVQTAPFEPLLLRETAGLFGRPFDDDIFTFDFKAGVGAQQIIGQGGFTLIDNSQTLDIVRPDGSSESLPIYVLQEVADTFDLGAEGTIALKGYVIEKVLTWNASVVAFLPFVTSGDVVKVDDEGNTVTDDDGNPEFLNTIERLNLEINAGLSLKIAKYFSFDWSLLVRRFPQVRDAFQIQNNFLLTLTLDVI